MTRPYAVAHHASPFMVEQPRGFFHVVMELALFGRGFALLAPGAGPGIVRFGRVVRHQWQQIVASRPQQMLLDEMTNVAALLQRYDQRLDFYARLAGEFVPGVGGCSLVPQCLHPAPELAE